MFEFALKMTIVCSSIVLLAGLVMFINAVRFLKIALSAAGVVVGHELKVDKTPDADGFKNCFSYPIVEYKDHEGNLHRVTLSHGTAGYQPFPTGKQVTILYHPTKIAHARIRSFHHIWSFPVMFTAFGIIGIIIGIFGSEWFKKLGLFLFNN
ncbi:MAG: DUF3592 domain-containing protein [Zavarzinella sp.]